MSGDWDAEFRPRQARRLALAVGGLLTVVGIVVAVINTRALGAYWRGVDQIAIGGLVVLVAAAIVVILTRPRLRVGRAGLAVRNLLDERVIPWSQVTDIYFPAGKRWPRVEMQAYEYVPVLAIQSFDRGRAVDAMDTLRDLMARYRPDENAAPRG